MKKEKEYLSLVLLMGYESIIDYLSDETLTESEIEEYIGKVT